MFSYLPLGLLRHIRTLASEFFKRQHTSEIDERLHKCVALFVMSSVYERVNIFLITEREQELFYMGIGADPFTLHHAGTRSCPPAWQREMKYACS